MLLNAPLHRHLNTCHITRVAHPHTFHARRSLLCKAQAVATAPDVASPTASAHFTQDDLDAFVTAYTSIFEEHTLPITPDMVDGTIPSDLTGTYVRNIPGLLEIGGVKIPQPFDGDGMVAAFTFANGKALFRNKYVRTEALIKEQAAGRMLYQGVFNKVGAEDTLFNNPFTLEVKKPANTSVMVWNDRLYALYEADLPHQLDPDTLQTLGRVSITPATDRLLPIVAAHSRVVQQPDGSRRWVAFGAKEAGLDSRLVFQELGEDGGMLQAREVLLKGAAFGLFHDVMVTDDYYIMIENPIRLDIVQLLTGYVPKRASFAQCLQYRPDIRNKVHLIPRDQSKDVESYELPNSFFCFHHWNAYEASDGRIVMDTCAFMDGIDFSASLDTVDAGYYNKNSVGRATALRIVLDRGTAKVEVGKLYGRSVEFPMIHPAFAGRRHTVGFGVGDDIDDPDHWTPPQSLIKHTLSNDDNPALPSVAVEVYNPGRGRYCQEPTVVPKAGARVEEDVWVLTYVYDAQRQATDLEILDGAAVAAGPVARIRLPFRMPLGLHGCWSSGVLGPLPEEVNEASSYDIRNGVADAKGVPVYC